MKKQLMSEGPAVPESVLLGLRAVHPKADCYFIPGYDRLLYEVGIWYEPDQYRTRMAQIILDREARMPEMKKNPGKRRWAEYVKKGWRVVFGIEGRVPNEIDVQEFRERDYRYKKNFKKELNDRLNLQDTKIEEKDRELSAHAEAFGIDEYPSVWLGKRVIPFNGWAERFGTRWKDVPLEGETKHVTTDSRPEGSR